MNKKTTTLHEKKGVSQPETTSKLSAEKIKIKRNKHNSVDEFVSNILEGSIPFLSKAITLVESTNPRHQEKANEILERCLPHANNSIRIGITGVPGVGKSTFIETFGKRLTSQGKKVAVLAIDPSMFFALLNYTYIHPKPIRPHGQLLMSFQTPSLLLQNHLTVQKILFQYLQQPCLIISF